jgi:probable phosphoglycerate mutase
MELYIVRHGKTYWNEERKIQGWADIDLTEEGREVAILSA